MAGIGWDAQPTRPRSGDFAAVAYIGGIASVAQATGVATVLFPELGALAHDVFTRPRGAWARAPLLLVVTPVLTAALGTLIARNLDYGLPSVLLTVGIALLVIRLLNSPIAPAISAGLLPVTLGMKSWWYPPAIVLGTALLAIVSLLWSRLAPHQPGASGISEMADARPDLSSPDYSWIPYFLAFLILDAVLAGLTGWRFLLYPPLVVIGFEMFAHSAACPWADRPLMVPVACAASGAIGAGALALMGPGPLAAMASMAGGIVVLRLLALHVPPALAVGLLPFVIDHTDVRFPVAVGTGTLVLTVLFLLWRRRADA